MPISGWSHQLALKSNPWLHFLLIISHVANCSRSVHIIEFFIWILALFFLWTCFSCSTEFSSFLYKYYVVMFIFGLKFGGFQTYLWWYNLFAVYWFCCFCVLSVQASCRNGSDFSSWDPPCDDLWSRSFALQWGSLGRSKQRERNERKLDLRSKWRNSMNSKEWVGNCIIGFTLFGFIA